MHYDDRQIIIAIDGASHFSEIFDIDQKTGRLKLEGSMEKYTEHLKKDRWLRREGYEVWRFSDLEVFDAEKKSQEKSKDSSSSTTDWVDDFFYEMGFDRYCQLKSNWADFLPRASNLIAEQSMSYEFAYFLILVQSHLI